jgi:hypothetical protein
MARTFIRQETQIRKSDAYTDSTAPTLAAYETNPVNIEDDLNSVRSMLNYLLDLQSGNWYDVITTPSTFENGAKRAVDGINQDLHDLERKRVLVTVYNLDDITVPADVKATGILTAAANVNAGDTVTIGTKTYTYTSPLGAADGDVLVSAVDASGSLDNLIAAVTLGAGSGVTYAAATTANTDVTAAAGAGDTIDFEALLGGTQGNLVATTENTATVRLSWGAATLTGGTGDVVVLTIGDLPTEDTAAIGAVTTLGTVVAYNSDFLNASLVEVSGTNAVSPKNLGFIEDTVTHDPILSGGRVVYVLFQSESNTDGSTMTGTTPNRAQITFVRINIGGTDLELVPSGDIAGSTIHYSTSQRKGLEDLNEQDFLRGAVIDIPASTTVTRQVGYDNQGTTPVDVVTHSYLDLEGAGLVWSIRDDLQATLLEIIEGSAGGTSQINIGSDVDEFDVDAAVNDFLQGVTMDSGGTAIDIGVTGAGAITSAGLLDLTSTGADLSLDSGAQLVFSDQWYAGSTYDTDLVLSDTNAEWNLFETNFGEVSLLNAINQAWEHGARNTKTYANCSLTTNVDTDVGGVAGGANLDAQLPDMSAGTFLTDFDVFVNGNLMRPGVDAAANNDYYPGTSLATGQLKFEFVIRINDVLCVIPYA